MADKLEVRSCMGNLYLDFLLRGSRCVLQLCMALRCCPTTVCCACLCLVTWSDGSIDRCSPCFLQKAKKALPVGPVMLGFFLFVVVGSGKAHRCTIFMALGYLFEVSLRPCSFPYRRCILFLASTCSCDVLVDV